MSRLARLAAVVLLAAPLAYAPAALAKPAAAQATPEAVGFDTARLKRLDDAMAKVVADGKVAGMTTLLVRHGQVVQSKTYGKADRESGAPMQPDTVFRIYSMTKPVTGVAMMILFEEGRWKLDDPITKFLPEMKDLRVMTGLDEKGNTITAPAKRPPTMRELMSHTAGFGYGLTDRTVIDKMFKGQVYASPNLDELTQRTAQIPLIFEPGTSWSYSIAVDLQGAVVERLSGQRFGDFLAERVFRPLKMTDTGFYTPGDKAERLAALYMSDPKTGGMSPFGEQFALAPASLRARPSLESGGAGLVSTARDYGRFAQMLLNGGELEGARILSPAAVELMGTNAIPDAVLASRKTAYNDAVGFGLDFRVVNNPRKAGMLTGKGEMSWSGAAGTWFWVDPENDLYFVGMIQRLSWSGASDLQSLSRTLVYQALTHPER